MSNTIAAAQRTAPRIGHKLNASHDPDEADTVDPFLDESLIDECTETIAAEDEDGTEIEIGQYLVPVRILGPDNGERDADLDIGGWIQEPEYAFVADELDGPVTDPLCLALESENSSEDSELPEEGPASLDIPIEDWNLPAFDLDAQSGDDTSTMANDLGPGDVNDAVIAWSGQPWCEHQLPAAFVPRVSLCMGQNVVIATGDATDALSLDDLLTIDEAPISNRTCAATLLDEEAKRILVVTVTGQLLIWNRNTRLIVSEDTGQLKHLDRAVDIWHDPFNSGSLWIRLGTGELLCRREASNEFTDVGVIGRCVALGSCDRTMRALLNHSQKLSLLIEDGQGTRTIRLPSDVDELAHARVPFLVTSTQFVVVGAREYGLWLSPDSGTTFRKIAGCRNVTTCTIGVFSGRTYVWAALFFELDDRAELVGIDCKTLRIHKLAEFCVVTDSSGPEDDPPERARIDCLIWDAARQRIWAAGCFGLTCFLPTRSIQSNS